MSMMDLASALGGGGGGPPGGGGLPPGGPPPGPPPDADVGGPPDQGQDQKQQFSTSLDALDAAEDALQQFIQLDPDEPDRAAGAKLLQGVIQLKAANQQSAQNGDMKSLARALQGGPGANAGPLGAALGGGGGPGGP